MLFRPEEKKAAPQVENEESKTDVESLNDGRRCKNRYDLTEKRWLIFLIFIGIILIVGVSRAVAYYPRERAENTVQQLYENQNKVLLDIGCSPKPVVKNMLSLLPEEDDIGLNYEIEERFIVIFQCNDDTSFCEVNGGKCTCEPTENGQTKATAIIKFRDRHSNNSEWQYAHRTLNIMNHIECVAKAII